MSETLGRLLDCAEHNVRSNGYSGFSFRELADQIGIKSASVHYYFPKKEDLGVALVQRYSDRFFERLQASLHAHSASYHRLHVFIQTYRKALSEADAVCLCCILGAETNGLPKRVSAAVRDFYRANLTWLEEQFPTQWTAAERQQRALQVLATLQGAMLVSKNLNSIKLFDQATSHLTEEMFSN